MPAQGAKQMKIAIAVAICRTKGERDIEKMATATEICRASVDFFDFFAVLAGVYAEMRK